MEDRHFSLSEVAIGLRVSERTVRRWIKDGKLKAYKPGRDYRIPESAVRALVEESEAAPKAEAPPSLFNNLEERRTPTLRPQIELVSSLADEWEREIAERSAERARESRAVRRTKRVFGDLAWAHEIHRVST